MKIWHSEGGDRRIWWHADRETGRAWIHCGRNCLTLEFSRPSFRFSVYVDEEKIGFCFLGFYFGIEVWELVKRLPKFESAFYWFEDGFWLQLFGDRWESRSDAQWWRKMHHFNVIDFAFGKAVHSEKDLATYAVKIPLDGKQFPATIRMYESVWKRPRAKVKRVKCADIKIENPPTFPGKGENSWDLGDDAIYGMYCRAESVADAIAQYVKAVLHNRFRRGNRKGWCEVISEN